MNMQGDRFRRLGCVAGLLFACTGLLSADTLDDLLADYRSHGLPLPPETAVLAVWEVPGVSVNGVRPSNLSFVIERNAKDGEKPMVWVGSEEFELPSGTYKVVDPVAASMKDTVSGRVGSRRVLDGRFPTDPDLVLAVQCKARGWDELAKALLDRSRQRWRSPFEAQRFRPRDDRKALAMAAWNHWCNRFCEFGVDRTAVLVRVKALLKGPLGLDTKPHRTILADMERTRVERRAKPGTLEAAIEGLLDLDYAGSG